jgi:hypothetical protein
MSSFAFGMFLGLEMLGGKESPVLTLWGMSELFSAAVPVYIPTSSVVPEPSHTGHLFSSIAFITGLRLFLVLIVTPSHNQNSKSMKTL